MQKIAFLTDSASDISKEQAKKLGITIAPIIINVDGKDYAEGVDFTPQKFYDILLKAKSLPVTSHISALTVTQYYKDFYDQGYTDVIHVTINSKGSNNYNAALMGKEFFFEDNPAAKEKINIYVVDSLNYTAGYGYPLMESARMAKDGASVPEILENLTSWFKSLEIYFCVSTLEFAKKSGRISCAAAFMGEMMGLKPIISIIDGETKTVDKVRGMNKLMPAMAKQAMEHIAPGSPYIIILGKNPEWGKELRDILTPMLGYPPVGGCPAGACIALNAGPDLLGIAFKGKPRE